MVYEFLITMYTDAGGGGGRQWIPIYQAMMVHSTTKLELYMYGECATLADVI